MKKGLADHNYACYPSFSGVSRMKRDHGKIIHLNYWPLSFEATISVPALRRIAREKKNDIEVGSVLCFERKGIRHVAEVVSITTPNGNVQSLTQAPKGKGQCNIVVAAGLDDEQWADLGLPLE